MKDNGLLAAGFRLVTNGGSTYRHQGLPPHWNSSDPERPTQCVIVRNSTGFYQIDPAKFPGPGSSADCLDEAKLAACLGTHDKPGRSAEACGCVDGNGGMRILADQIRALGFEWGSYSNMAGCQVAACDTPEMNESRAAGFVAQDYALMVQEWGSAYVMVDSVGIMRQPEHAGTDGRGQGKWQVGEWRRLIDQHQPPDRKGVILHSCHVACAGNYFSGPTLAVAKCDAADTRQQFTMSSSGGVLRDGDSGLCAGCIVGPCANTALHNTTGGGLGFGMQGCVDGNAAQSAFSWNVSDRVIRASSGSCLALVGSSAAVVLQRSHGCNNASAIGQWTRGPAAGPNSNAGAQMRSVQRPGMCLCAQPGGLVPPDPWCLSTSNMWRTNTDVHSVWNSILLEMESLVGLGTFSRPGSWGFGDGLEIGHPGVGTLTWEESKTHLAIWAVASSPLLLGNDVRPGRVQQRVLALLKNPDMLAVNQAYSKEHSFAGDRMWSAPVGQELWAKPLGEGVVGVVLFNRDGDACTNATKYNPYHRNVTCGKPGGSKCCTSDGDPMDAPCTDDPELSTGAQVMALDYSVLPMAWFSRTSGSTPAMLSSDGAKSSAILNDMQCDVFDIFATAAKGKALGRYHSGGFSALVPPHGCRFLRVSNCTQSTTPTHALPGRLRIKSDDVSLQLVALGLILVPAFQDASHVRGADASRLGMQAVPLESGTVDVTAFGAVPDGETNNVAAIDRALAKCVQLGGCTLLFPVRSTKTVYRTSSFVVPSHTTLLVPHGVMLRGTETDADNIHVWPTQKTVEWPSKPCMSCPYACGGGCGPAKRAWLLIQNATNVTVRGGGTLHGGGHWWWCARADNERKGVPPQCASKFLLQEMCPPRMIHVLDSSDILLENMQIMWSPFWTTHVQFSNNVEVNNVSIWNPHNETFSSANGDGFDISSSTNVHIHDVVIDVSDDASAVRAGSGWAGQQAEIAPNAFGGRCSTENVTFERIEVRNGHGVGRCGEDARGGIRNVTWRDIVVNGSGPTQQGGGLPNAVRFEASPKDGGLYDGITFARITGSHVGFGFSMMENHVTYKANSSGGPYPKIVPGGPFNVPASQRPVLRNIVVRDVDLREAETVGTFFTLADAPVENFTMKNITILPRVGAKKPGWECASWGKGDGKKEKGRVHTCGKAEAISPPLTQPSGCVFSCANEVAKTDDDSQ